MSGIEIAGLVLGGFPLLISGLEHYREGFEPLEEWWKFRTTFIEFIDDVEHQMMRYTQSLTRLLDPILPDAQELQNLIQNPQHARWKDQELNQALDARLGSERERCLRIFGRLEEVLQDLKRLLKVENNGWVDIDGSGRIYHLTRLQVAFSRGKHRKVLRLAKLNQDLEEILAFSDTIIPIAEMKKASPALRVFDNIRKHLCAIHEVLKVNWKCQCPYADQHRVHVRLTRRIESDDELESELLVTASQGHPLRTIRYSTLRVEATRKDEPKKHADLSQVTLSEGLVRLQVGFENREEQGAKGKKTSRLRKFFGKGDKQAKPIISPTLVVPNTISATSSKSSLASSQSVSKQRPKKGKKINDLCAALATDNILGHVVDDYDRAFNVSGSTKSSNSDLTICTLAEMLNQAALGQVLVARQERFEIAAQLASAVLQLQVSPWLGYKWSAESIFLETTKTKTGQRSTYIQQDFASIHAPPTKVLKDWDEFGEEETRQSLFNLGVVIMELIFARPLVSCPFRQSYLGPNGQANDQTDWSTARQWSKSVLPECGVELADVVRRCLDCSFGPKPDIKERRFREAVFQGVVEPLEKYMQPWKAAQA